MAASVVALPPVRLPSGPSPWTPEQTYWKSFKSALSIPTPSLNPVTHISSQARNLDGSSTDCDLFAISSGTRVQLYSLRARKIVKSIARFDHVAHSPDLRRDGRILVAGDDSGTIQVFDIASRAILKTWTEHKQPAWTTKFSPSDPTALFSTSDDNTVKIWDLAAKESVLTLSSHQDYVRSGSYLPGQAQGLLTTGSYDQTVKIWDPRAHVAAVMTFKLSAPIEEVLPLPNGATIAVAASNLITILDLVAAKPLQQLANHQKTVTSLCLASGDKRLLSGALDGHVKVFETGAWNVVYGAKYAAPVLALSVLRGASSYEDKHVAIGLQSGILSIKTRLSGLQKHKEKERAQEMQAMLIGDQSILRKLDKKKQTQGQRIKARGLEFHGEGADIVIANRPRGNYKPKTWEHLLRKGNYSASLDVALELGDLQDIVTVLTALKHRSATRYALASRDEKTLQPIYLWICKHITNPAYVNLCVDIGLLILDLYAEHAGESAEIDRLTRRLHIAVRKEVERSQQAHQTKGMLGMLMASA